MKIISVVGARPNFMKISPFIKSIQNYNVLNPDIIIEHLLLHTGQHYDERMSELFFESLNIPKADINLGIGSGSHAKQIGLTMIAFEKVLETQKPDWVVVVGDVNATLACSVTAKKHHVKVCHIEAGLRSGDERMPEEINRLVTDRLSDLLLTPDTLASENLRKEGIPEEKIEFVGNIMIDTLKSNIEKASKLTIIDVIKNNLISSNNFSSSNFEFQLSGFAVITMHRPSNVDAKEVLEPIIRFILDEISTDMTIYWPIHPRTQKQLQAFDLWEEILSHKKLILLHPLGYHEMLKLNMDAKIMLTDSGGLQEECTVIGTPCMTLRWNTERPITLQENGGLSILVGNKIDYIRSKYNELMNSKFSSIYPPFWDGKVADRCLKAILNYKN